MRTRQANAMRGLVFRFFLGLFFFFGGRREEYAARGSESRFFGLGTQRRQIFGDGRAVDGSDNRVGEALQHAAVIFSEGIGLRREGLENADGLLSYAHRSCEDGANTQSAATIAIDARIGFGIVAAQQRSRLHALAGKS